jgi:hypothetical protein
MQTRPAAKVPRTVCMQTHQQLGAAPQPSTVLGDPVKAASSVPPTYTKSTQRWEAATHVTFQWLVDVAACRPGSEAQPSRSFACRLQHPYDNHCHPRTTAAPRPCHDAAASCKQPCWLHELGAEPNLLQQSHCPPPPPPPPKKNTHTHRISRLYSVQSAAVLQTAGCVAKVLLLTSSNNSLHQRLQQHMCALCLLCPLCSMLAVWLLVWPRKFHSLPRPWV